MGQKAKARAVAAEHGFQITTPFGPSEIQAVLEAAAAASGTGGLKGTLIQDNRQVTDTQLVSDWTMKGPGGLVKVLNFRVNAAPSSSAPGTFDVSMSIGHFLYQKGSLFTQPTLNGSKVIKKFNEIVCTELTRGRAGA